MVGVRAEVCAAADGVEVVGDVGDVIGEVVDAAANEDLAVGGEASAVKEDAWADLVGAFVDGGVGGGFDLVEGGLEAPVVALVEGGVGCASGEAELVEVVAGVAEGEAAAELDVSGAAGGGHGLGARRSGEAEGDEEGEGANSADTDCARAVHSAPSLVPVAEPIADRGQSNGQIQFDCAAMHWRYRICRNKRLQIATRRANAGITESV